MVLLVGCTLDWESVPRRDLDGASPLPDMSTQPLDAAAVDDAGSDAAAVSDGGSDGDVPADGPADMSVCGACGIGEVCDPATARCDCVDDSACGAEQVCDVAQGRCVTEGAGTCQPCSSDRECTEPAHSVCVEMTFRGEPVGAFCQPTGICDGPYRHRVTRTTLSGAATAVCLLDEALTTCSAIRDMVSGKRCVASLECGEGGDDAACWSGTCSHPCNFGEDCVGAAICSGASCVPEP